MPPVTDQPPESQPPAQPPPYTPPSGAGAPPPAPVPAPPPVAYPAPAIAPADRVRAAWQRRNDTDYIFSFWTALGWSILTCGVYTIYVLYQLVRRSRDHNLRRIELLDAATTLAWEQAQARGLAEELRPSFERIAPQMAVLRNQASKFRDPTVWMVIALIAYFVSASFIVAIVVFILLDGDLIAHDHAEGAIETELSTIYARLGAPVTPPDPARLKGPHNYVGRVIATIFTCGIYSLWWEYNIMTEGNTHFTENWKWEDDLARSVQQLIA
jgi:hypothetical protein